MLKMFYAMLGTFIILLLLISCVLPGPTPVPKESSVDKTSAQPRETKVVSPPYYTPSPTLIPTPTPDPYIERYSFMLLGGDYRTGREGTGWGNKTDVMVLAVVDFTDPPRVTLIQLPRNLYIPISDMQDMWAFAVYRLAGPEGMEQYIRRAFGLQLSGIFYVNMDSFVSIIADIGPICIDLCGGSNPTMAFGDEVLVYLRDNDNNWGYGVYDAERRVFQVLAGIVSKTTDLFWGSPIEAASLALNNWGGLVEMYPGTAQSTFQIFSLGWRMKNWDYFRYNAVQLEEPTIIRGDTPLSTRGMIVAEGIDLRDWILEVLSE